MMDLLFADKQNRDERFKALGGAAKGLRRGSIRGQQIHPMYVEDRKAGLTDAECGFGNTIYKTYFPVLYRIVFPDGFVFPVKY